ncbi:MAG: TIGR00268 family protein [Candidatus Schekmanbacteria bacterium RBG_13_48_7]|uniref:TIGR00268 family protein n=1 Tax=Candidatus Schekmanbacteria bacterium RBG_13_48_7 TaxID=1817878 RepID=A0A1F7RK19_9BACT|nr:MAG: TIGR00268 family protein [Candidatus Schekmanbacteria bacterium RBG_13_48_7]
MKKENKLLNLKNILKEMECVLVAFSGGVDSTFLLKVSSEVLKESVLAVTAISPTYPRYEYEEAVKIAGELNVKHKTIDSRELENPEFVKNTSERCFHCKTELFSELVKIAQAEGFKFVLDATNADDLKDYRPGREAAKKLGIKSPLVDTGFTKQEIRDLSKKLGLRTWNKPSFACLASRFPYGTQITAENLEMVYKGEMFLKKHGFHQYRVRHHAPIVRLELDTEGFAKLQNQEICEKIVKFFKKIGYLYITVDIQGYRTGSLNETLNLKQIVPPHK